MNLTRSLVSLPGNRSNTNNRARKVVAWPQHTSRNRPGVLSTINNNYCVDCVAGKNSVQVTGKVDSINVVPVIAREDCLFVTNRRDTVIFLPVNPCVVTHVHFAKRYPCKRKM